MSAGSCGIEPGPASELATSVGMAVGGSDLGGGAACFGAAAGSLAPEFVAETVAGA